MPAISFSAIEILPALLDKTKTQTIRPLNIDDTKPIGKIREAKVNDEGIEVTATYNPSYKKPYLKVGDIVTLYWKMRSKAKWFCKWCGNPADDTELKLMNGSKIIATGTHCISCRLSGNIAFPKLLGKVRIIEVFEIEMGWIETFTEFYVVIKSDEDIAKRYKTWMELSTDLAKRDGFKSAEEMFAYFDKNYDLSQPKRFVVYRWEWI